MSACCIYLPVARAALDWHQGELDLDNSECTSEGVCSRRRGIQARKIRGSFHSGSRHTHRGIVVDKVMGKRGLRMRCVCFVLSLTRKIYSEQLQKSQKTKCASLEMPWQSGQTQLRWCFLLESLFGAELILPPNAHALSTMSTPEWDGCEDVA